MVNYLGRLNPNLSTHTFNFRKLLEKDSLWCFKNKHENEIDNLKQLITNSPVLKFYNPKLPMKVLCDASMKGLGLAKTSWHLAPISYASRSLTSVEENHCQLDKEILSIVLTCDTSHEFIYG